MHITGAWPFEPLKRTETDLPLSNGGVVQVEAVEQRGFRSDGWSVYARYLPPGGEKFEKIGSWEGYNHYPEVYLADELVVIPSPDQRTLYVRTRNGKWKFFILDLPGEHTSLSMRYYSSMTTLSENELRSIRGDLDPDEKGWSTTTSICDFSPENRELYIIYRTGFRSTRHIRLKLSEDGTDLTLISVTKEATS